MPDIGIIVLGSLNTDLTGRGVGRILGPGELTQGEYFSVGPGGKSRNIAEMAARLAGRGRVAMLGRTVKDPYGLWRPPYDALRRAGVNTAFVKFSGRGFPGIALIPVDKKGNNQIYVLPGANSGFSPGDIRAAAKIFKNAGVMAMSLELPKETAVAAIDAANENGLKVILDPGGINEKGNNGWILKQELYALKPNEHEAGIITGTEIRGFKTARKAAEKMLKGRIKNVIITAGKKGAYLFNAGTAEYFPAPQIRAGNVPDETGCGDQVTAVLAALTLRGLDICRACRLAVLAGTMQFYRRGVSPVTRKELREQEVYIRRREC